MTAARSVRQCPGGNRAARQKVQAPRPQGNLL